MLKVTVMTKPVLKFASLKKDKLHGRKFKTRAEARMAVVEYIELFYNSRRLLSTLDINHQKKIKRIITLS